MTDEDSAPRDPADDGDDESETPKEDGIDDKTSVKSSKVFTGESEEYNVWKGDGEEYGEDAFSLPIGEEETEYPPVWEEGEYESEHSASEATTISSVAEVEETEEEKAIRIERERLLDLVRGKLLERIALRRRNIYLHRKLADHFKKRRMDHVLKEDSKGFELESKYLKRLYAFQEFKEKQESEIYELTRKTDRFKLETDQLEEELNETLNTFIQRQKELSLNLVSTKTGKKLNEKTVDRLLRRQVHKCVEKGKLKLKYVKLKNLIEEKEKQLKAMENFGDGLHIMDYEQLKIDNQNYSDKIEEKEEELTKLRVKTHGNIQNLAQVREKAYAIEGDIELTEAKYDEIELKFNNTRERVGQAKKKRDALREEYARLKTLSGLLTNNRLLKDFETSIDEKEKVRDILDEMRSLIKEKKKQQSELAIRLVKKPSSRKNPGFR